MKRFTVLLLVFGALVLALPLAAQSRFTSHPTTPPLATAPMRGTFYFMQRQGVPPMPFNRFPELPVYEVAPGVYLVDDRSVDYAAQNAAMHLLQSALAGQAEPLEGNGTEENNPPPAYGPYPGQLWLEITQSDTRVTNLLHGTEAGKTYELFSKASLTDAYWLPVELKTAPDELTPYSALPKHNPTNRFFRAQHGQTVIAVYKNGDAAEPGSLGGVVSNHFIIYAQFLTSETNDVTVHYRLSGTASNGVDYTALSGTVVVPNMSGNLGYAEVWVEPWQDSLVEFDETVTLTIIPDPAYLIDPALASETMMIADNLFQVVTELDHPVGLDYHPGLQALIASVNFTTGGEPYNFVRIYTNGISTNLFVTNWSGIHGLGDEVKLAFVKEDYAGFHTGEMFFGTGVNGVIGKLSADGTVSNLNWAVLTDNTNGTDTLLRGSLYVDQTGIFGGALVAVTGNAAWEGGGVWRINASGQPAHITTITNAEPLLPGVHLEGVITLPNEASTWGPWAGRLVTGAEAASPEPLVYAVAADGSRTEFPLGIAPEDFDVIQPGCDAYVLDYHDSGPSKLLRLPQSILSPFVGKLLVMQAGEQANTPARLYIVEWNADDRLFEALRVLSLPEGYPGHFEHACLAPIFLPSH